MILPSNSVKNAIAASGRYALATRQAKSIYTRFLGKVIFGAKQYEEAVTMPIEQMANARRTKLYAGDGQKQQCAGAYRAGNLYEKRIPEQLQQVEENPDAILTFTSPSPRPMNLVTALTKPSRNTRNLANFSLRTPSGTKRSGSSPKNRVRHGRSNSLSEGDHRL